MRRFRMRRSQREQREQKDAERQEFREWKEDRRQQAIDDRLGELKRLSNNGLLSVPKWALRTLVDEIEYGPYGANNRDVAVASAIADNVLNGRPPYSHWEQDEEEEDDEDQEEHRASPEEADAASK